MSMMVYMVNRQSLNRHLRCWKEALKFVFGLENGDVSCNQRCVNHTQSLSKTERHRWHVNRMGKFRFTQMMKQRQQWHFTLSQKIQTSYSLFFNIFLFLFSISFPLLSFFLFFCLCNVYVFIFYLSNCCNLQCYFNLLFFFHINFKKNNFVTDSSEAVLFLLMKSSKEAHRSSRDRFSLQSKMDTFVSLERLHLSTFCWNHTTTSWTH